MRKPTFVWRKLKRPQTNGDISGTNAPTENLQYAMERGQQEDSNDGSTFYTAGMVRLQSTIPRPTLNILYFLISEKFRTSSRAALDWCSTLTTLWMIWDLMVEYQWTVWGLYRKIGIPPGILGHFFFVHVLGLWVNFSIFNFSLNLWESLQKASWASTTNEIEPMDLRDYKHSVIKIAPDDSLNGIYWNNESSIGQFLCWPNFNLVIA